MIDERYMRRAIDLAGRAELQSVSPNPRVGAVLVYRDRVIGEGYHQRVGTAHAEVRCLESVRPEDRELIPQSTMYVTLEPCAHQGRTPSCAQRLVHEHVRRVVVGRTDPFEAVSGRGIEILRAGGVEVVAPMLPEECTTLAEVFITNQVLRRPWITLKWAQSADGFIDHHRDHTQAEPVRFSSPFTQMMVHHLRSQHSAILVGRHTYELDQPKLTNRYIHLSPFSPRPILLTRSQAPDDLPQHWLTLPEVSVEGMALLLRHGITSLLVEGGALTHQRFMELGLWDQVRVEVSPMLLHGGVAAPTLPHEAQLVTTQAIDGREILCYRRGGEPLYGTVPTAVAPVR